MHCSFAFCDEAYWPGDRSAEGELKRLITEPTLFIEPKGLDGFEVRNCLHVLITGNEDWLVPASADERRFAVFAIEEQRPRPPAYFSALYAELGNSGLEAMLYDLLHHDLAGWHPRWDIPQTKALLEQKAESLHGVDALVADLAHAGTLPYPLDTKRLNACVSSGEEQGEGLWAHAKRVVPDLRYKTAQAIARVLRENWRCACKHDHSKRWVEFPSLTALRQHYAAKYGPQRWDNDVEDWS